MRARDGGTLYLTTSRRTRSDVVANAGNPPSRPARCLYRWSADSSDENPLSWPLLAHADRFVVTGDSVSMMVEVASLGRPLAIFALPVGSSVGERARAALARLRLPGKVAHLLNRLGIVGYGRDLGEVRRLLIEKGLAVPLGVPFRTGAPPLAGELNSVVGRIQALVADGR